MVLMYFLVDLEKDQNYARCKTTNDDQLEREFVMLLFAAGETVDESKVKNVPDYLKQSEEISLMNICRVTIRKHLLQMMQGLSILFACVGSSDPVRVLRLYTTNTLDIL